MALPLVQIRRARPEEAVRLGDIGFSAWEAGPISLEDGGRTDRRALLAGFRRFAAEFPDTILVADSAGLAVGWGAREDRDNFISDLWVAPAAQRQGVGTALLMALIAEIRQLGFDEAKLEVVAANGPAVRLYERHGFAISWRMEKFSQSLGYAIDKLGMNKSLSP